MPTIVIWGAGGHAKVVAEAARLTGWTITYFLDDLHPERDGEPFFGGSVRGGIEGLAAIGPDEAVAYGIGHNQYRLKCFQRAHNQNLISPVIIHPRACVSESASIGGGGFVAAGAIINPDAQLGEAVIVNTGATVDHDCRLGTAVHIAPGAHLAGGVAVGDRTLIGIGAVIRPGIFVGSDVVVGAGAVVVKDVADGQTVCGVPARNMTSFDPRRDRPA